MEKEMDDIVARFKQRRSDRMLMDAYRKRRDERMKGYNADGDWKENDHPRDNGGKFAPKGTGKTGGAGESKKTTEKGLTPLRKRSKMVAPKYTAEKKEISLPAEVTSKFNKPPYGKKGNGTLVLNTKEAADFVKNAHDKKYISPEEIKNSDIVKTLDAISDAYAKAYGDTSKINTPEREETRRKIKEAFMNQGSARKLPDGKYDFDGEIKKEHKAEIIIGLPAAGKSTTIANPDSEAMGAFIFDSDMIKEAIPEFDMTGGGAAGAVHKESKKMNQECLDEFLKGERNGENLIIPVIGDSEQGLFEKYIDKLEDAGYDVEVKFRDTDPTGSLNRAYMRALETGRIIPSEVLTGYGDKPRAVWDALKGRKNRKGKPYRRSEAVTD